MFSWFNDYKTHLVSIAISAATFSYSMGWIDASTYQVILGFLGPVGLAALRHGVSKAAAKAEQANAELRSEMTRGLVRASMADTALRQDVSEAIVEADPDKATRRPGGTP